MLKIWPDGWVIEEDLYDNGPEQDYGRSDDYFVINLEETMLPEAVVICSKHFSGAHLQQVIQEISQYYPEASS